MFFKKTPNLCLEFNIFQNLLKFEQVHKKVNNDDLFLLFLYEI